VKRRRVTTGGSRAMTWEDLTKRLASHLLKLHRAVSRDMPESVEIGRLRKELNWLQQTKGDERDR
jgi:hypothetical protein